MKKVLLFITALLFFSIEIFSQTISVPKRKKALLMKMTATWCGPCGSYHFITENIYHEHSDSILFINSHVSSSDVGDIYSGEFHNKLNGNGEGIPSYNVNGIKQPSWPPIEKAIVDSAKKFLKKPVVANVAFKYQITGDQLAVQTSVKFFAADKADEYYVNVFIVENKITTKQKVDNTYTTLIQDRVSRGPIMSGNAGIWGEKFATGNIATGKFYDVNFNSTLKPAWIKNNLRLVAVIWKKTGNVYTVLSAEDVPSVATDIKEDVSIAYADEIVVYPVPVIDRVNVDVKGNGSIEILNVAGQRLVSRDFKTDPGQVISINTAEWHSGIYFLRINQNGKIRSKKIIVQNNN